MLSKVQLEAIYRRLSANTEAIDRLIIRLNAHAEDMHALYRRIEQLERLLEREIEVDASPENCNCIGCGEPIEFENHVCYSLYGHPDADPPPDPVNECLTCWDSHEEKYRKYRFRASWIKPIVVRNGKAEPYIPNISKED